MENKNKDSIFKTDLFKGKTALITGGGTGIGFSIAKELGKLGCHVILAARRKEQLKTSADKLTEMGINVNYYAVDIRKEEEVESLYQTISNMNNTLDFLVNNAGGQFSAPASAISSNGFRAVTDLNLQGTWHMTSAFAKYLKEKENNGRIVNIVLCLSSGMPGMVHAGAARAGVVNMTKTLAYEWGPNIKVNAVAPGTIKTEGLTNYDSEKLKENINRLPVQRAGKVEEVANAVNYLLSPGGDFITGTTLEIDGGEHLLGATQEQQ